MPPFVFPIVESASAAVRVHAAAGFLRQLPPLQPVTIVGATRAAADDLARRVAVERPATFGVTRVSLTQLAARSAIVALARAGVAPSTPLGAEALAARAVFDALQRASLEYFAPVAATPGFPRALARTLQELRLTGVTSQSLAALAPSGPDLGDLLERFEAAFVSAGATDRATLLQTAAAFVRTHPPRHAVLLLDVPLDTAAEAALVSAVLAGSTSALVTVPVGDGATRDLLVAMGGRIDADRHEDQRDLGRLRRYLFQRHVRPDERPLDGSLEFFSAPGEGRECVEIARRILGHARGGVPFDDMAVLVRAPRSYFGLLEHAFRRAGIPGWFDRGMRRPHPAGRAFLAMLACAAEGLSASRFAEYLSLAQVPAADLGVAPTWAASADEAADPDGEPPLDELAEEAAAAATEPVDADNPVGAGRVQAPWRWEQLIGDAAVIGQSADRWRRRLAGLAREVTRQQEEARRQDGPESPRLRALLLTATHLEHLTRFALPIVETLAAWPATATWGEWLDHFEALAPRVLRTPAYVARVLADLRPMSEVGPIDLDEARRVLATRLLTLDTEPPARRFGRVFVGTPHQARGRTFRVVFVPGLAERIFPQKPREDPLLLDDTRVQLGAASVVERQVAAERLLLQLAVGAASAHLHVSYPRIELSESRARVPSFYALDLIRAATGTLPDHETLEERARMAGRASLAWPAPEDPAEAIDDQEHDLAVLRRLLDQDRTQVKGHAHYLLGLNEHLRRSVVSRWAQGQPRWSPHDGLIRVTPRIASALASQRLTTRAYSLSALQKFSACPYQFLLSSVYRLQPMERPEPLQRMDPLTRGSLFHEIQASFLREMRERGALPVTAQTLEPALEILSRRAHDAAREAHDQLAPAVDRVWNDEIADITRDLLNWLRHVVEEGPEWVPLHFELGFGRVPGQRDEASLKDEVTLPDGFKLRGAIDLVEQSGFTGLLRVTDHKTGRKPDRIEKTIVGGGAVLQPVLYAMAVEAGLQRRVSYGRLFYCTAAGSFYQHPIPLNDATREAGLDVLRVIDRAIAEGFLAPAPREEACRWCDCRPVCGPGVPRRVVRKPPDKLLDLVEMRRRP